MKAKKRQPITLSGSPLSLEVCRAIAQGAATRIAPSAKKRVNDARSIVEEKACGQTAVYGINTGFGYLAREQIPAEALRKLQQNLVRSHASGWGEPLSEGEARLALALRLNTLLRGYSGARFRLCEQIQNLLFHHITPVVPEYGSVGASGDLIPLSHLCLPLIGEGEVFFQGKRQKASTALKKAKLAPVQLEAKEGLSFVNGTEVMLAVGALALQEALELSTAATKIAALSFEALGGNPLTLDPELHRVRNQQGQIKVAALLRSELKGSEIHSPDCRSGRVQDPYSLRCIAQIHGPTLDSLTHVHSVVERELGAVSDNPTVIAKGKRIVSGGNFHGQALALAFDFAAIAVAELANVSERRLDLLFSPQMSGLTPFLTEEPGTQSGYMTLQYLSASLINENKVLSHPASTDSIPGNIGIEDHVSMGMTAARKFRRVVQNVRCVLACEYLAAAQATGLKKRKRLGKGTLATFKKIRKLVPPLKSDRVLQDEVAKVDELLRARW